MPDPSWSAPTRRHLPIILIRGFGGLDVEDERALAYQGFNEGSVYPHKRGENYIYEGLILRLLKHRRRYYDATNVVGYFANPVTEKQPIPADLAELDANFFAGHKVVIDPGMARRLLQSEGDPFCTVWVFRYYDLNDRTFAVYGEALVRLIQFIQALLKIKGRADPEQKGPPKVNIIAHSMGGLIVREAIQRAYPKLTGQPGAADRAINKVVTLGTPHKGISFQLIRDLRWLSLEAEQELEHFNPEKQKTPDNHGRLGQFPPALPARAPADRGRDQLPQLRRAQLEVGKSPVRDRGRVRPELQSQRRPGQTSVCADRRCAAYVRAQVSRRVRFARSLRVRRTRSLPVSSAAMSGHGCA